ncbi:MAG: ATP-binding protein [Cyanobacteria bacterium J06634_5]
MFDQLQHRLLRSYLGVLIFVLVVFAVAVRVTFTHSLHAQFEDKLEILAKAAALELEIADDDSEEDSIEDDLIEEDSIEDDDSEEDVAEEKTLGEKTFEESILEASSVEAAQLEVDNEELVIGTQSIEWFDNKGQLLATQGSAVLTLPLAITQQSVTQPFQVQQQPEARKGLTISIPAPTGEDLLGYVRVSDSLADLRFNLTRLDWGLCTAMVLALGFSWIGGQWLTRQSLKPVEESFHRLQQFTADASHELRSPITAIKTNASVALKYADRMRPTDLEKFNAITSAANQMTHLTTDLLALARLDRTQTSPQMSLIALQPMLQQLVSSYEHQAQAKSISLWLDCPQELIVRGQEKQLIQLFKNLIDNALRYTPTGGAVKIQALASNTLNQPTTIIHIQDSGIGLSQEQIAHVFDRFWQAETARSYQSAGFGLGLSIAHKIVCCHGGTLSVKSEKDQGSQFTVELPMALPKM